MSRRIGRGSSTARVVALALTLPLASSVAWAARAPRKTAPAASAPSSVDPSGTWQVRWDRAFAGWKPTIFDGTLSLQRNGDAWTGQLTFEQSAVRPVFQSLKIDGNQVDIVFQVSGEDAAVVKLEISGIIRDDRLVAEMRWGRVGWTPLGGRRLVQPRLVRGTVEHSLPAGDLAAAGVQAPALAALMEHAAAERSSAIVIVKDGKIGLEMYREGYDGAPLVAMSASKSVVSLAVGLLVADGKLTLDTTMGELFPEWKGLGPKTTITVRQLLSHVSGLDPTRADPATATIRETALAAKLVFPPGARFQYNNCAVDFLAVVVQQAAGMPLDAYLETRLFKKLDIVGARWMKDKEGTPRGAGELIIRPVDLAKLGQLMLDGGKWQGEQILPADWVARSVEASQSFNDDYGLLWWREGAFGRALTEPVLAAWQDLGLGEDALRPARALLGKKYATEADYAAALQAALGRETFARLRTACRESNHVPFNAAVSDGPVRGFAARGWLGQYLVVLPEDHVVAVRMRQVDELDYDTESGGAEADAYRGFADDVARLF